MEENEKKENCLNSIEERKKELKELYGEDAGEKSMAYVYGKIAAYYYLLENVPISEKSKYGMYVESHIVQMRKFPAKLWDKIDINVGDRINLMPNEIRKDLMDLKTMAVNELSLFDNWKTAKDLDFDFTMGYEITVGNYKEKFGLR